MKSCRAVVLAFLAFPLAATEPPRQVTLPLSDYEKLTEELKKGAERPSLTVVDTLRFGGSFRGQGLTLTMTGRSSGKLPPLHVVQASGDVSVFGCDGEGIVTRADEGGFSLTPLAGRFEIRCRVAGSGSDRLDMTATRGVLHVAAAVTDGEIVSGGGTGDGGRRFSIVRNAAPTGESLPPTAVGRYRITLLPDETRFLWQIEARNPNRARRAFDVVPRSGERIQQVNAQVPYEVVEGRYRFELPPGDSTLVLSGASPSRTFTPPVEASVQYVLVESDPLLRAEVTGAGRRISPRESGIAARFRGAQAFLLGKGEALSFATTKLETLHTTTFAVKSVRHLFYLPADGPAVGESAFVIDNQGAAEITFPTAPQPIFASFGSEPVMLTKGKDGKLTLPLGHGVQQLLVQHRQEFGRKLGFATATLLSAPVSAPASTAAVEVRTPREWVPLVTSFAGRTTFRTPAASHVLWILLLALLTERVLAALGLSARARLTLAGLLGLAALFVTPVAVALLVADLAAGSVFLYALLQRSTVRFGPLLLVVLLGLGVVVVASLLFTGPRAKYAAESPSSYAVEEPSRRNEAQSLDRLSKMKDEADTEQRPAAPPPPAEAEAYQGLPARVDIPAGETRTFFSREMLPGDVPHPVRVLAISSALAFWLRLLPAALAAWALVVRRQELLAGLKERLAQAQRETPPAIPQV